MGQGVKQPEAVNLAQRRDLCGMSISLALCQQSPERRKQRAGGVIKRWNCQWLQSRHYRQWNADLGRVGKTMTDTVGVALCEAIWHCFSA